MYKLNHAVKKLCEIAKKADKDRMALTTIHFAPHAVEATDGHIHVELEYEDSTGVTSDDVNAMIQDDMDDFMVPWNDVADFFKTVKNDEMIFVSANKERKVAEFIRVSTKSVRMAFDLYTDGPYPNVENARPQGTPFTQFALDASYLKMFDTFMAGEWKHHLLFDYYGPTKAAIVHHHGNTVNLKGLIMPLRVDEDTEGGRITTKKPNPGTLAHLFQKLMCFNPDQPVAALHYTPEYIIRETRKMIDTMSSDWNSLELTNDEATALLAIIAGIVEETRERIDIILEQKSKEIFEARQKAKDAA